MNRRLAACLALAAFCWSCSKTTPVAPDNTVAQVNPPTASALTVTAPQPELYQRGSTMQLTATLTLSNGFTENRTSSVTWSSSNSAVLSVSSSGLATAGDEGTATVSATLQNIRSGDVSVRVRNAFRAPDPPPGQRLPKPDVSQIVADFFHSRPDLVARSCQDLGGTWEYLDALVDRLRLIDLRWGYNGRRGDPNFVARDEVAYHWGAGPSLNSRETYAWDIMISHCGSNPQPGYLDMSDQGTIWLTRGRFTAEMFVKP